MGLSHISYTRIQACSATQHEPCKGYVASPIFWLTGPQEAYYHFTLITDSVG